MNQSLAEKTFPLAHWIYPLSDDFELTFSDVGAKAMRLHELLKQGYPVPRGVVISSQAFHDFCDYNHIELVGTHSKGVEDSGEGIQKAIKSGGFSPQVMEDITKAVSSLPYQQVAVRSSSAAEDGNEHSMAGQFDTYLEVDKNSVADRIKDCWASMFNPAVLAYYQRNKLSINLQMGVVIQEQIDAIYAGVLFSLDPLTKSTDKIVIEWVEGLGEALVSGEVTPNQIKVNRVSKVLDAQLASKLTSGLTDLVDLSLKAEKSYGHPVDIEWCIDSEGLKLLQIRPITALNTGTGIAWTSVNMSENFPNPLTPFTWSIADRFYNLYMSNILRMFGWKEQELQRADNAVGNLSGIQAGRIYYNLNNWYQVLNFFPIGSTLQKYLNNYIGQNIPFTFKSDSNFGWVTDKWKNPLNNIGFFGRLSAVLIRGKVHVSKLETHFYNNRDKWRSTPYKQQSLSELQIKLENIFTQFGYKELHRLAIADITVLLFPGLLNQLTKSWFPTQSESPEQITKDLLIGLELKSMEPSILIERMATEIMVTQAQSYLDNDDYVKIYEYLPINLKNLFDDFMYRFGGRCYLECMLVHPTFEERHDLFWQLIKKYQKNTKASIAENHKKEVAKREVFTQKLIKDLPQVKKILYKMAIKLAQRGIKLREQARMIQSLMFGEIRLITLQIGERLMQKQYFTSAEDVFYLSSAEVADIVNGKCQFPEQIMETIKMRKEQHQRYEKQDPPEFFFLDKGEHLKVVNNDLTNLDSSQLKGLGVSGGKVTGTVKIILDPVADNRLEPGDILVTRSTDPGWTPLLLVAGGIVLEKGGLLSHGAIVSREFGIPAIVAVEGAIQKLKDGTKIAIDGDTGMIECIK